MKTPAQRIGIVAAACFSLVGASLAVGTPLVSIGDGRDQPWNPGLPISSLVPGPDQLAPEVVSGFFAPQGQTPILVPSDLQFNVLQVEDLPGNEFDSLVMSWDQPAGGGLAVAGWEYDYGVDPDLNNHMIHFSLLAPPGIWDVGLELIDVDGDVRGWWVPMPMTNVWQNYWIDPSNVSAQGPFTFAFTQAGFELDKVQSIRLYEAGNSVAIPLPQGTPFPVWNAWNHLEVRPIPEPLTSALGMIGLVTLTVTLRRRRVV